MFKKCEGIVIRTNDYGESNKIVTIYSRELGKVGLMARGAKSPVVAWLPSHNYLRMDTFLYKQVREWVLSIKEKLSHL